MSDGLFIDGETYTFDDLTYREQRLMREKLRELVPPEDLEPRIGADGESYRPDVVDAASPVDYIPAFIYVIKQRTDSEFTLEQAMDFKPADLVVPAKPRPTKPRAKS